MDLEEYQRQKALLFKEYADHLPLRLKSMQALVESLKKGEAPEAPLQELYQIVHSLSGSAPSFGFHQLGHLCQRLETEIKIHIDRGQLPGRSSLISMQSILNELQLVLEMDPSDDEETWFAGQPAQFRQNEQRIYLIEEDEQLCQEMMTQLAYFGYKADYFTNADAAVAVMDENPPAALVVDVGLSEGMAAGPERVTDWQQQAGKQCPIIYISGRGDWQARLTAVRAGGSAYLLKPVSVPLLVAQLDNLLMRHQQDAYRVLIVDDDQELAAHYALVLRQAGILCQTLQHAEKILDTLISFRPEMILMDLYMPDINGIEAAKVVRQHQDFFSIPTVFLSTEQNREIQLAAMQQGDDFLQKPIEDAHLIASVKMRAERARSLGALMYHDGLTGLLNHSYLKLRLDTELARVRRRQNPLCFVLIDLDRFKSINDRHGHSAGDRVLKSLARLFQERLRQVDVVGRYGGEEFGIILPDTAVQSALQLVESLRQHFVSIIHRVGDAAFHCTFSAGIAEAQPGTSGSELIDAADAALYRAKAGGRNRTSA